MDVDARAGAASGSRARRRTRAHQRARARATRSAGRTSQELLDAGIDVITTVNVQHIESLNDVVEQITGVAQRETVPDAVVRAADQIEVVDLAPQSLRDRLSAGFVYPAERVDAALSNYFRLGNLTALRELALLWLADEVDTALKLYRAEHGITGTWQARERVVVALTGGPRARPSSGAARASPPARPAGELLAVHVSQPGRPARRRRPAPWPSSERSSSRSAARTTRSSATTCRARSSNSPAR